MRNAFWCGLAGILPVFLAAVPATAAGLLHPMFADHAVLQRDRPIPVYGQAAAGTAVTVRLGPSTATARAGRDGRWTATLPAMPAGGPHILTAEAGAQKDEARDVLLGDVFLCTGQSNMQLSVRRAQNNDAEIAAATDDQVRELAIDRVASPVRLSRFQAPVRWKVQSPQTAGEFSASCFFFARELRRTMKVPVGLVVAAWGGTRVRGWVGEDRLQPLGYFNDDLDMLALYRRDPKAAQRRWDKAWEAWWLQDSATRPWQDRPSQDVSWRDAPPELGPWGLWPGLSLPEGRVEAGVGFVGQMWLATTVNLTAAQAAQTAVLDLGRVTEEDKSWVNGQGVGGTSQQPAALHDIPAGILRAGPNSIVTNIFCSWRNCGLIGPAASRAIRLGDGTSVALDGPWRYQPVEDRIAPQLPWGPMHGVSLQYNGMIAPIGPYALRGAIWYQGESNLYFARNYQATLEAMMGQWRGQFGADLPFVIVQIPQYGPPATAPGPSLWSDVREAQRRASQSGNAALVVTLDIGDAKNLHPGNKQEVGRRIAIAARHLVYGENAPPSGARAMEARRVGNAVAVRFSDVTGALASYGGPPNAFELCGPGQDGCRYARAEIRGDTVTLENAADAARVRYCWGDSPVCTLSDGSGLPAGPFELPIQGM